MVTRTYYRIIKGKDNNVQGAVIFIGKTKRNIERPINKLYPTEFHDEIENNVNRHITPKTISCHNGGLETKILLLKNLIYIESFVITVRRVELPELSVKK